MATATPSPAASRSVGRGGAETDRRPGGQRGVSQCCAGSGDGPGEAVCFAHAPPPEIAAAISPAAQQAKKKNRRRIFVLVIVLGETLYMMSKMRSVLLKRKQSGLRAAARKRAMVESSK